MFGFSFSRDDGVDERSALIHQEVLKLAVLMALTILGFFITRAIAASNRATTRHDAAEWYARGQRALAADQPVDAVEAFRHASVMKRGDREYALAFARALVAIHRSDDAEQTLLSLRDTLPEDPEVNLELARLASARGDAASTLRYYHNALYAPWPSNQIEVRRQVRLELIRFLIGSNQSNRAESELVALSTDLPDTLASHLEVGGLFRAIGNQRRALDQYQQALRLSPANPTALAGAGRAAFATGDYTQAQGYLRDLANPPGDLVEVRALVNLVLTKDPLAARIGSSARRGRLMEALSHVSNQLQACSARNAAGAQLLIPLADEIARVTTDLERGAVLENDTIETSLELVDRAERASSTACPPVDTLDRALMLIAERHGVARP